jgi:hypothetical protein
MPQAPRTVGPRETRHLKAVEDSHLPKNHLGNHPFESIAAGRADRCIASQVGVDDLHVSPPELPRTLSHRVLKALALESLSDLLPRRLPHIHDRFAGDVLGSNLAVAVARPAHHRRALREVRGSPLTSASPTLSFRFRSDALMGVAPSPDSVGVVPFRPHAGPRCDLGRNPRLVCAGTLLLRRTKQSR